MGSIWHDDKRGVAGTCSAITISLGIVLHRYMRCISGVSGFHLDSPLNLFTFFFPLDFVFLFGDGWLRDQA